MSTVLVTGSNGLIGSEAVRFFCGRGHDVLGLDNDMRRYFFGDEASTAWVGAALRAEHASFSDQAVDIRDAVSVDRLFRERGADTVLVLHTAAQPSHDWAAREPVTDFSVNATGTLTLLEAARAHCPEAVFIFTSTNKVYGDAPNRLPLVELETRWEIDPAHPYHAKGIDESLSIDQCLHSLFGASKVAADVLVQEYGRYFGMKTSVFRGGCLTGPLHAGAELHGFLAYLMKCAATRTPYRIFGYGGKQVRDNIHSADLIAAFDQVLRRPPPPGRVYNIGGSRHSHCSMIEAIRLCEEITGERLETSYVETQRIGDHLWWVSDVSRFQADYPEWAFTRDVPAILREIYEYNRARWTA